MAIFKTDWSSELAQVKQSIGEVVDEKLNPMFEGAIKHAGDELNVVIQEANRSLQHNIQTLSDEIHDQRRVTKEDIKVLIDYAAEKIGSTIDDKIAVAKREVSSLLSEKIANIKNELEDAAVRSRKTLYFNVSVSVLAALGMAVVGIVYRKITLDQLDLFSLFRVLLLSTATGTGLFSGLKLLGNWKVLNKTKKNVATIALGHLGLLRPNGALGLFIVSLGLLAAWAAVTFRPI